MKNIHILPTDNYAPLVHSTNKYGGYFKSEHYSPMKEMGDSYQNIYITSDEEILVRDYYISSHEASINQCFDFNKETLNKAYWAKKIILTTDQDLIKDGVQAIDDEFLEWFVKNPSCEEVKLENHVLELGYNHYKIIIPKEETLEDITLEEVFGSEYCQFSVVENKLAILYRNQEQLLKAIKLLSNEK